MSPPRAVVVLFGAAVLAGLMLGCLESAPPGEGGDSPLDSGQTGDGGTEASPDSDGGLPLESACAAMNGARCAYLQRCGLLAVGTDGLRECEQYFTATECGPTRWPSRVKQGTLRYHPAQAQACVDSWNGWSCEAWQESPPACTQVTSPAALLGGACFGGPIDECLEGVCTGGTCPRHCRMLGSSGELCETDADCRTGLYCQRHVSGGVLGTCAEYGVDGHSCGALTPCATGYYCAEFSVCRPARKVGEACEPGTCEPAAFCAYGPDGGICVTRLNAGGPCTEDFQCRSDLICVQESGTCQPRGPLPEGAPCGRRQSCASGLACVGTQPSPLQPPTLGRCATPVEAGGGCTSSFDCKQPLACVFGEDGGVCAVRAENGAPCSSDRDCQLFSRCVNASCTPLPARGEPCPSGTCLWGSCEQTPDAGPVCKAGLGSNAPCSRDGECASQRCVSGSCLAACTP